MTWVAAGVASAQATKAGVQWFINRRNAKKDEKNRPQYTIPGQINENVDLAKQSLNQSQQQALQGLPEAQKQQYLNNINQGLAYGLSQVGTRAGGLAGVAQLNQSQNQSLGNLAAMDAQARMQNQQNVYAQRQGLMNANQVAANYTDQAFQLNKLNPYYENIARRNANNGALFQNLNNADNTFVSLYSDSGLRGGFGGETSGGIKNDIISNNYDPQNLQGYDSIFNKKGLIEYDNPNDKYKDYNTIG